MVSGAFRLLQVKLGQRSRSRSSGDAVLQSVKQAAGQEREAKESRKRYEEERERRRKEESEELRSFCCIRRSHPTTFGLDASQRP